MEHQVRVGDVVVRADEPARLEVVRRARAAAQEQPLRADERALPLLQRGLHRHGLRAQVLDVHLEVVLEVLADTGQIGDDRHAERLELARGADAGELEQLRRVDRAAAEDHLAGTDRLAADHDADGARPLEDDALDERVAAHLEVRPRHRRMEVRARRAQAAAAVDRPVELREALLPVAVHVVGERIARLLHRVEERVEERRRRRSALEHERPLAAAPLVGAGEAALHPLEVRQAVGVVPRGHARVGAPALVVERVAALEDHPVDRARAAEHLAARVVDPPPVHVRLGLRLVPPVVALVPDRERERGRHVDEDVPEAVVAPRLEDEHARRGVLGQPRRERRPGRAAADDHVVPAHPAITTVCSSLNASSGAVPPTRPIPLAVPERPPNGRCVSQ